MIVKTPAKTAIYFLLVSSNCSQLQNLDASPYSIQYFFSSNIILRCIAILPLQRLLLSFLNLPFLFSLSFFTLFYPSRLSMSNYSLSSSFLSFLSFFIRHRFLFSLFHFKYTNIPISFFNSLYATSFLRKTDIRTRFLIFQYGANRRRNFQQCRINIDKNKINKLTKIKTTFDVSVPDN